MDVEVDLADTSLSMRSGRRPSFSIPEKLGIVLGRHLLYSTIVVCVSVFTLNFLFYGGLYAFPQIIPQMKLSVSPCVNLMLGAMVELPGCAIAVVLCANLP